MRALPPRLLLKLTTALCALALLSTPVAAGPGRGGGGPHPKLDRALQRAAATSSGESRVIIEFAEGAPPGLVRALGGLEGRHLKTYRGQAARIGNSRLEALANNPWVKSVHLDRPTGGEMNRTAATVGARAVQRLMGYDGAGVGVAIIDSGIPSWHDDLMGGGIGGQKVVQFVDFVNHRLLPYDDNGHGAHVAGVIAGSGYDSYGQNAGIAPGAHLVSLKVLDAVGAGYISDVIGALDWVIENHAAYNIRVVNLSVGASVTESYLTDPLTLAAKRVVEAGIVVVVAAGNLGTGSNGQVQYGAITAPGNAPWVLTVGASSHMGTVRRGDDTIASFSSRGPTAKDFLAKPDLVAPGTGTVSLSDPTSTFFTTKSGKLISGGRSTPNKPYLSLSGTSMAAPVVTGSVALMLQANPALTPNAVKAILQYTAQSRDGISWLAQGAGFLNTRGAVRLAQFFRTVRPGDRFPRGRAWSRHVIWGNHRLSGGMIVPTGSAWATNIVWGAARDGDGENIVWGTLCRSDADCDNIVWGNTSEDGENIVWGSACDETDPDCDNIVWGTGGDEDNIVWGTACDASDPNCDNIVWGTGGDEDNIVWGNSCDGDDCENIVWGTNDGTDNVVWGANGETESIVWGASSEDDNVTWGSSSAEDLIFGEPDAEELTLFDETVYDTLFEPVVTTICTTTTSTHVDAVTGAVTEVTTTACTAVTQ